MRGRIDGRERVKVNACSKVAGAFSPVTAQVFVKPDTFGSVDITRLIH